MFSCVLISGKIAAATQSWWSLHPDELKLLSLLATSENTANSKDIPVFLPYKSPTVSMHDFFLFSIKWVLFVGSFQICGMYFNTRSTTVLPLRTHAGFKWHWTFRHAVLQEFHRYPKLCLAVLSEELSQQLCHRRKCFRVTLILFWFFFNLL